MRSCFRLTRDRGSALVELTVALPVLLIVLFGAADFGRAFFHSVSLNMAARSGAERGSTSITITAAQMQAAAVAASPSLALTTADVTVAEQRCECARDDGTSLPTPTAAACASTCAAGSHKVYYAVLTVSKPFNLITRILPGVPSTIPLQRTAWQRIQ